MPQLPHRRGIMVTTIGDALVKLARVLPIGHVLLTTFVVSGLLVWGPDQLSSPAWIVFLSSGVLCLLRVLYLLCGWFNWRHKIASNDWRAQVLKAEREVMRVLRTLERDANIVVGDVIIERSPGKPPGWILAPLLVAISCYKYDVGSVMVTRYRKNELGEES